MMLYERRTMLQTSLILDKIPLGIIVFNQYTEIVLINESAEECINKTHNCLLDLIRKIAAEACANEELVQKTVRFSDRYDYRILNISIEFINASAQILVIITDETRNSQLEHTIIKAEKLAVAGYLAIGSLMEIRNPLTGARGFCQLIENGDIIEEDYIAIIARELEEIQHIIENSATINAYSTAADMESIYDMFWIRMHSQVYFHKMIMITDMHNDRVIDNRYSQEQIEAVLELIQGLEIWKGENIYIINFAANPESGSLKLDIYSPQGIISEMECAITLSDDCQIDNPKVNIEIVNNETITLKFIL